MKRMPKGTPKAGATITLDGTTYIIVTSFIRHDTGYFVLENNGQLHIHVI